VVDKKPQQINTGAANS